MLRAARLRPQHGHRALLVHRAAAFAATLDHPTDFKGMHGFFFNSNLGFTDRVREYDRLEVGSDVWLGHNSVISSSVSTIGE